MRDVLMAGIGATVGLIVGVLPFWDGPQAPAAADARPEGARPPRPDIPARPAPPARPPSDPADPLEPAADAFADAEGGATMLYGPDGAVPCDAACIGRLTESFLGGSADEEDRSHLYSAIEAIATAVENDRSLRRRFLNALGQLEMNSDARPTAQQDFLIALATHYDLSPGFSREVTDRLLAARDPEVRVLALHAAAMRQEPGAANAVIEDAIARESGGPMLVSALEYVPGLPEAARPGTQAAIRQMATQHRDPAVRRAALNALAWSGEKPDADRRRILERGLSDEAPGVRLSAIQALAGFSRESLSEADRARYGEMVGEIANDTAADPQVRMEALGLLSYGVLSENESRFRVGDHHFE